MRSVVKYKSCFIPREKLDLDFTVTRLLMKLFRTSNKDDINECCYYFNFKLPSEILPFPADLIVSFEN